MDEKVASIYLDRGPTYPVWAVYVPDGGTFWKRIMSFRTEESAKKWCEENGYTKIIWSR